MGGPPFPAGRVHPTPGPRPQNQDGKLSSILYARAALYFDEVARCGSIRRASETLHIAPSAIDRQVIQLEDRMGVALFERLPHGLRLTAAGEILIETIRRGRKEFDRAMSIIDDLQGLRRGCACIAVVEGAVEFLSNALEAFHALHPHVEFRVQVMGSTGVIDALRSNSAEIGLTFNPPEKQNLKIERTLLYQLGAVMTPDHPLAVRDEIGLAELADHDLVVPDESLSLRPILDHAWSRRVGEPLRAIVTANSISMLKSAILSRIGIGLLTQIDVFREARKGELVFVPLRDLKVPLSVLSVISLPGRTLSVPAALLLQHLSISMMSQAAPSV